MFSRKQTFMMTIMTVNYRKIYIIIGIVGQLSPTHSILYDFP